MAFLYREIWSKMILRKQPFITYPGHIHDELELIYIQDGSGTGVCDGKIYKLQKGDFFLVFPNQSHFYPDGTPGCYILLAVKPSSLPYHQEMFPEGCPANALCRGQEDVLAPLLLSALEEHSNAPESPAVFGYLTVFFHKLLSNYQIETSRISQALILKILEYCAQHYQEDITVVDICQEFGVSRSHASHTFRSRTGMSFPEYINSLRLTNAEKLLKNQEYSITRVANLSGFPTIRTFNRVFIKRYGVTPSQYRTAMKKK